MGYNSNRTGASVVSSLNKADSSVQSVKINGQTKTPDASGTVDLGNVGSIPESFDDSSGEVTIAPNSSVIYLDAGLSDVVFYLIAPTNSSVENIYSIAIRMSQFGNAFSFDKDIRWANDNPPVLDSTAVDGVLEINIKYVDGYYLGTWAFYALA